MPEFGWFFPSTGKGESDGFMDAQLEHFQWNHEHYIAREAIQNAIDARLDNDKPVSVVFRRFQIPISEFPNSSEFKVVIENCLEFNSWQEEAVKFLTKAKELLESDTLTVLRIGDYNTCWLIGLDDDKKWHWNRLVKASGTSSSKGATWWSFWIGKWAPIAASRLRAVFYSTKTEDWVAFQWKARLTSHLNKQWDDVLRGVWFYSSVGNNESIRSEEHIPAVFRRDEIGTDIFVMGYENIGNWEYKLAESVIQNFWLPIYTGDLTVKIVSDSEGEAVISKDSLLDYIKGIGVKNPEFPKQVTPFIEAYVEPDEKFDGNLRQLGEVTLYVKKFEGFPKRVMMARKPKILVQKKEYRVLREPYAAVFLCTNDEGNRILREMEPPAHDSWDEDRYEGGSRRIWAEIDTFVREKLRWMEALMEDGAQDVAWLDKFLPDSIEEDDSFGKSANRTEFSEGITEDESPREVAKPISLTLEAAPTQTHKTYENTPTQEGSGEPMPARGDGSPNQTHENDWANSWNEDGDGSVFGQITSDKVHFRSFARQLEWGNRGYQFVLSAKTNCVWDLSVIAVGDDANAPIKIESAFSASTNSEYAVIGSTIKGVAIEVGRPLVIHIKLHWAHRYALTLSNHEGQ